MDAISHDGHTLARPTSPGETECVSRKKIDPPKRAIFCKKSKEAMRISMSIKVTNGATNKSQIHFEKAVVIAVAVAVAVPLPLLFVVILTLSVVEWGRTPVFAFASPLARPATINGFGPILRTLCEG
jgi:hypothetical protein